jgi:Flp pilus assembly protein TadD
MLNMHGMRKFELPLLAAFLCLLAVVIFRPALEAAFVFDDEVYLVGSPLFKDAKNFTGLFSDFNSVATLAARNLLDSDISTNFIMRPLTYGTFHLNYRFGGMHPGGFRMVNICIHILNALLVWGLGRVLLQPLIAPEGNWSGCSGFAPMLASLVFFLHPLQLETAVYVIQRATSLCALFYLLGLVLHFHANRVLERKALLVWRVASSLSIFAAMLSKESAVTAPLLAVALDVCVFGRPVLASLRSAAGLLLLMPYLPWMLVKVSAAQSGGIDAARAINIAHGSGDPAYQLHYFFSQIEVWWRYLRLFIWPSGLNIDPELQPILRLSDTRLLVSFLGWGLLLGIGILSSRNPRNGFWIRPLSAGVFWFVLTLLPDSSFVPLPDLMAEHRTYIPLAGLCIGCAGAALGAPVPARFLGVGAVGLSGVLALASLKRCQVWSSPVALWEDTVRKSPGKVRCWLNLGAAHYEAGHLVGAEEAFVKSLQLEPTVPGAANLATVYLRLGQAEKAVLVARDGLRFRPTGYDHLLLIALAEALCRSGRAGEAVQHYEELLAMNPRLLVAINNLGQCLLQIGQYQRAREIFSQGLRHHPEQPNLLSGLAAAEAAAVTFRLRLGP